MVTLPNTQKFDFKLITKKNTKFNSYSNLKQKTKKKLE